MINPIQWLRANYARNLADYRVKVTPSEAARILGRSRDPGYEKRRRALVDEMRRQQGKGVCQWQK